MVSALSALFLSLRRLCLSIFTGGISFAVCLLTVLCVRVSSRESERGQLYRAFTLAPVRRYCPSIVAGRWLLVAAVLLLWAVGGRKRAPRKRDMPDRRCSILGATTSHSGPSYLAAF